MKYYFVAFVVLLSLHDLSAQSAKKDVELILRNGNRLNGYVFVDDIPKQMALYTSDIDSISISYSQIKSIRYADNRMNGRMNLLKGFFNVTETGVLFGNIGEGNNVSSSMTVQTTCGYGFHRLLKIGLGAGYDQYDDVYTVPVYLSVRGDVFNKRISPIYFVNAGYAAARGRESDWQSWANVEGGKMIDGGIGFRFVSIDGYNILVSLGYKIQDVKYTQVNWEGQVSRITERENRRLRFSIGIGF